MGFKSGVCVCVSVYGKDAVVVFYYDFTAGVKAEGTSAVTMVFGAIEDFGLVDFFRKYLPK